MLRARKPSLAALLATLAACALAAAHSSRAADTGPGQVVAHLTREYLDHRSTRYESPEDPACLAAVIDLLDRVSAVATFTVSGRELVDREILSARLGRTITRGMERAAGKPSRLRTGPSPAPGTEAERRWARGLERLAVSLDDLLPDEVAAARSDAVAEIESARSSLVRERLSGVLAGLDSRARVLSQVATPLAAERDHLRTLRGVAGYRGTLEEVIVLAEVEARSCAEAMERVALDAGAPSAAALIERLKEEGAREDYRVVAKEEARRAADFARDQGLVTIPEGVFENLWVEDGDASSHTPFGYYVPVGWRGPQGHYILGAFEGSDMASVSRRREGHRLWLRGVAAHEGVPGHHLHFSVASRTGDELQRLQFDPATTEGWGLFVEGMLARAGYFAEPVEARMTPLRMRRWRALRVVLDLGLHTGRLTRERAIARMQRDLGFDKSVATEEVDRYRDRPGYYSGYMLGAMAFERLERTALERGGPAGSRRLRDRILSLGPAVPLEAVVRLAGDARVPVLVR